MHHTHDLRTCLEAIGLLDDYLSRELTAEVEQEVNEHLRLCEDCARHYGFERWLRQHIRDRMRRDAAPARLHAFLNRVVEET